MSGRMQDRRALDVEGDRNTRDYLIRLEKRLSALIAPDYTQVAPTFLATAEVSNDIYVGVQLHELDGSVPDGKRVVEAYTSTDELGAAVALDSTLSVSEGTQLRSVVSNCWVEVLTDEAGRFTLLLTHTAAATYYLNVKWKDRLFASDELVWT